MSSEVPKPTEEKIISLDRLAEILQLKRSEGKKIGLITGGFDVIHVGHVRLVRFAKEHVDILVVGVEQDETIRLSKGPNRPVNPLVARCDVLSAFYSVNYIFAVPFVFQYGPDEKIDEQYTKLYRQLMPDFLITNTAADSFWELKQKSAQDIGIGFLGQKTPKDTSSSSIAKIIQGEI